MRTPAVQFRFIVRCGNYIRGGFDSREDAEEYATWLGAQRPTWVFTVNDTTIDQHYSHFTWR